MGCLQDIKCGKRVIIGIRDWKDCDKPESDIFINDAPGITLKSAAAIASDEQKSGYDLLKSIIKNATVFTFDDFVNQINSTFQYDYIAEIRKIKYFDGSVLPMVAKDRGLVLKRWRSDMAQIYVEYIHLKSATSGTFDFKIIDGNETKTVTVQLQADIEKSVFVDYMADSEEIRIVADNTAMEVYSGPISSYANGCSACGSQNENFFMTGWNGNSEELKYFGIGVTAMVKCVEEKMICKLLPRMSFIIWYRAQMMFWDEALKGTRLNPISTHTKAIAEAAYDDAKVEYDKHYANFVPTIKNYLIKTKGDCIKCNSSIKYANTIP